MYIICKLYQIAYVGSYKCYIGSTCDKASGNIPLDPSDASREKQNRQHSIFEELGTQNSRIV